LAFSRQLIQFRRQYPIFRKSNWLSENQVCLLNPDSSEIIKEQWQDSARAFSIFLNSTENAAEARDDNFLLCFNAMGKTVEFTLPTDPHNRKWEVEINTAKSDFSKDSRFYRGKQSISLIEYSISILKRCRDA
jgi:pullulanase/glycogen debranching enzyme